ncbi:MAG TPA: ThiF family adenylyltransferase [Pyrinomonadaceae bacterium]|nr:ThiF family adenylyltransferase [Pyrinomonadaceae bacterium]HMP64795.1 ThiF family adenylyltransferase [Pyrinomonadaceae bacterium]
MKIDLSFSQAAVVMPREYSSLRLVVVGAGGTGSFAIPAIARLMFELNNQQNKPVEMLIVDPDIVESANIPRGNFCAAEVGRLKAQTLAARIALAWGIECHYAVEPFDAEKHLKPSMSDYRSLTVIVGCVDNHFARRDIHNAINRNRKYGSSDAPTLWWIDGGNGRSSGQVLLGSNTKRTKPDRYFTGTSLCHSLPAPSLVYPDLLEAEKTLTSKDADRLSCPDRVRLGEQSLNINQRVAVEIAEMLTEMFLIRSLKRFASYFDLETGTSRSLYCTPDQIAAAVPKKK